jgi:hypothetical protein
VPLTPATGGQRDPRNPDVGVRLWQRGTDGHHANLGTENPAEADIRAAVDSVTCDLAYRAHANRLQAEIR